MPTEVKLSHRQLSLPVGLKEEATFDNFISAGNAEIVENIAAAARGAGDALTYLVGSAGSGKTHLLQAACRQAAEQDRASAYLPLQHGDLAEEILEGLDTLPLVCLDAIHHIVGNDHWERALLRLMHGLRPMNGCLLVAATLHPAQLNCVRADLRTRLAGGLVLQLRELDDSGRRQALRQRAHSLGLQLPAETENYLLTHTRRDMHSLADLLERLDKQSLAAQRRLTVPFVKDVLSRMALI